MTPTGIEHLHRFHSYCARFPSEIVEEAVEDYTKPGESIYDPFCGSGTTLVASLARGRRTVGSDIDTLAGILSEVKCFPKTSAHYARWKTHFLQKVETAFDKIARSWGGQTRPKPGTSWTVGSLRLYVPAFESLQYWFPPQVIAALAAIADAAHDCSDSHYEKVALLALSACVIAKWPATLSYAMDVDHTRPHRCIQSIQLDRIRKTYRTRLEKTIACLGQLRELYVAASVAERLDPARVVFPHDARDRLPDLQERSQNLVVTSPPYFNAVDYPRAHRYSVCWMNGHAPADLVSRKSYIGLRYAPGFDADTWLKEHKSVRSLVPSAIRQQDGLARRLTAFYADLEKVLVHVHRVLKPGANALFVIANNVIRGERVASHRILGELGRSVGFTEVRTSSREIARIRRRFPVGPFGFDGPMTNEFLVALRRPRSKSPLAGGGRA